MQLILNQICQDTQNLLVLLSGLSVNQPLLKHCAFFHLYLLPRHFSSSLKGLFAPLFTPGGSQALKAQTEDHFHTLIRLVRGLQTFSSLQSIVFFPCFPQRLRHMDFWNQNVTRKLNSQVHMPLWPQLKAIKILIFQLVLLLEKKSHLARNIWL